MDTMHADFPPPPDDERFGIGHNGSPEPLTPQQVTEFVAETHVALTDRRDQLTEAARAFAQKYPVIETEDVQAAATENLAMIGKAIRMGEDQRKNAKEPYLSGGRAVDAWFAAVEASLKAAEALIEAPATAYAQRLRAERAAAALEQARTLAREAERAAQAAQEAAEAERASADHLLDTAIAAAKVAEAAEAKADAKPAEFSRTTGTYGSTSSLQQRWEVEIMDPEAVPDQFWVLDVAAVKRAVREGARNIPGCRIYEAVKLRARA